MDTLVIGLFDSEVTFAACLGDGRLIDWRTTVDRSFNVMHAVAVIAGRGNDQAQLQQSPAMNAVLVLRADLGILHRVFLGQAGIAVTVGAGLRQVQLKDRGIAVFGR
jgi:hypothetical protein